MKGGGRLWGIGNILDITCPVRLPLPPPTSPQRYNRPPPAARHRAEAAFTALEYALAPPRSAMPPAGVRGMAPMMSSRSPSPPAPTLDSTCATLATPFSPALPPVLVAVAAAVAPAVRKGDGSLAAMASYAAAPYAPRNVRRADMQPAQGGWRGVGGAACGHRQKALLATHP